MMSETVSANKWGKPRGLWLLPFELIKERGAGLLQAEGCDLRAVAPGWFYELLKVWAWLRRQDTLPALSPSTLEKGCKVLLGVARKGDYAMDGWHKGQPMLEICDAMFRHLFSEKTEEFGLQSDYICANLVMLCACTANTDDRILPKESPNA